MAAATGLGVPLLPRPGYLNALLLTLPWWDHLQEGPVDVYTLPWIVLITGFGLTRRRPPHHHRPAAPTGSARPARRRRRHPPRLDNTVLCGGRAEAGQVRAGGLVIDPDARVRTATGGVIPGLLAAGAGGLYHNAYAGGLAAALVFGLAAA